MIPWPALRVNQLDAMLLDCELVGQFKEQLHAAFKYWRPEIKDKYSSELLLALQTLLFKVTVWDHATTYGAKLQNLVLVNSKTNKVIGRKSKAIYAILVILLPYLYKKVQDKQALSPETLDRVSLVYTGAKLLNFVAFLYSGKYITLALRLLGLKYASGSRKPIRNVNYEFQNRQLVWNALMEFIMFLLPIINFRKLARLVVRPWASAVNKGSLAFLSQRICAICFEKDSAIAAKGVTNPYVAGCKHCYCYVCLSLRLDEGDWPCLKCGEKLQKQKLEPYY